MDLKHQHRSAAATTSTAAFTATPGKRTLTEGLDASPAAAASYSPARGGIIQRQGGDKVPAPQLPKGPDSDAGRGATIATLLSSFQHVHVGAPVPDAASGDQAPARGWARGKSPSVQVDVSIPYWNNKYVQPVGGKSLDPPDGFDKTKTARNIAIYTLGIGANDAVVTGKGYPDEIGALVTRAITLGLIDEPPAQPGADQSYWATAWRPVLEAWLIKVGIGLDCNGFVYEALNAVKDANGAATTGHGIIDNYHHEDVGRTAASIPELLNTGNPVTAPDDLQVADVMITEDLDHCRIVIAVDRSQAGQGITDFTTAESTAAPQAAGSAANGPRIHYWRFTGTTLTQGWTPDDRSLRDSDPPTKDGVQAEFRRHLAPPTGTPQRKAAGGAPMSSAQRARGAGAPLPPATRQKMERSFLTGFDRVRVHEGDAASAIAAHAYADGEDLHFAPGRYQPGTTAGDALIGHELAHVVQQREGRVSAPQGKDSPIVDDPGLEAEADRMGEAAAAGRPAVERAGATDATAAAGAHVQRRSDDAFAPDLDAIDALFPPREPTPPSDADRHAKVGVLVQWTRDNMPDKTQIDLYLQSAVPQAEKVATLGKIGNELTRMEYMLGGLYNSAMSGVSWRTGAGSTDMFPATYLATAGGLHADENWCTSFVGYGYARMGRGKPISDALGSGPKQRETGEPSAKNPTGGVVFPQSSWEILRWLLKWQDSKGAQRDKPVAELVQAFLANAPALLDALDQTPAGADRGAFLQYLYENGETGTTSERMRKRDVPALPPRVGDLLILNTQGDAVGQDDNHTAMIDRFAFPILSTIEGNLSDTTGGRALDLTNPKHLAQIYFISSPATQIVAAAGAGTGGDPGAGPAELARISDDNQRIFAVFEKLRGSAAPTAGSPAKGPSYNAPSITWGQ